MQRIRWTSLYPCALTSIRPPSINVRVFPQVGPSTSTWRSLTTKISTPQKQFTRSITTSINEVFDRIDTDGSGTIDRNEFNSAMEKMGYDNLMAINRGNLFDLIDADNSGSIDRKEFHAAMEKLGPDQLDAIKSKLPQAELSEKQDEKDVTIMQRFLTTFHVTVSKIMPAGFGWQLFSGFAADMGFQTSEVGFWLMTGLGDGLFVCTGHTLYCLLQNAVMGYQHNMTTQLHTGVYLGTAAICSGSGWQPTVELLTAAGCSFNQVLAGTVVATTAYFFTGLRLGRLIYPNILQIEGPTYGNLKADAALSLAIGGAGGLFVGTDVSFGAANWARPFLGIEAGSSTLLGCSLAGTSTGTGFFVLQSMQNIVVPKGKNWVD